MGTASAKHRSNNSRTLKHFDQHPCERILISIRAQCDLPASRLENVDNLQAFDALHNSRELGLDLESLQALPTRLIEARCAASLTQKALADQLGVSAASAMRRGDQ